PRGGWPRTLAVRPGLTGFAPGSHVMARLADLSYAVRPTAQTCANRLRLPDPRRLARRMATQETLVNMGALSHIRVLDLTRVLAGPWCAQTLADFGADVIKIERPEVGDDTRHWGPPYLKAPDGTDTREAAYYLAANRNKRSVTVDIATPEGQQ